MVAESLGAWGPEAQAAFKVLARSWATRKGQTYEVAISQLYEGLSIRLMRAAARSTLTRVAAAVVATDEPAERKRARRNLAA